MRCAIAQPCIGSKAITFRASRSSVPCTRSVGLPISVTDNRISSSAAGKQAGIIIRPPNNIYLCKHRACWNILLAEDNRGDVLLVRQALVENGIQHELHVV